MAELTEYQKIIRNLTPDQINDSFKQGQLTRKERDGLMLAKAHDVTIQHIEKHGFFKEAIDKSIEHWNQGWADIVKGATAPSPTTVDTAIASMHMLAGEFKLLGTMLGSGVSEVTGSQVERYALMANAHPGLARVLGIIADVGSGVVGTGVLFKGFANSVKAIAGRMSVGGEKAAETTARVEALIGKETDQLIMEGLKAEVPQAVKGKSNLEEAFAEAFAPKVGETPVQAANKAVETVVTTEKALKNEGWQAALQRARARNPELGSAPRMVLPDIPKMPANWTSPESTYQNVIREHGDQLSKLAREALSGVEADRQAFGKYVMDLITNTPGGKPRVSAKLGDMLSHWDSDAVARGDFAGALRTFAEDMAVLDPKDAVNFILKSQQGFITAGGVMTGMHNAWYGAAQIYRNMLLPFSWVPTFLDNTIALNNAIAERALGAAFGEGATVMKEPLYMMKGLMLATGDAIKAFGNAFTTTGTAAGKFTNFPQPITGKLGRIINTPTDAIKGMDNLFISVLDRASHYASAIREAELSGITTTMRPGVLGSLAPTTAPTTVGEFVTQRVANPTVEAVMEADKFAKGNVFQGQMGMIGQWLEKLTQWDPFHFPFLKYMVNGTKYSWARTPGLQLLDTSLYRDIVGGGPAADAAVGRLVWSNLLGSFYYDLAKEGFTTGGGPVNPERRKSWLATHEPYSLGVPGNWMPYSNTTASAVPLGIISDFVDIREHMDDASAGQMGMAVALSIIRNIGDHSIYPTGAGLIDAINDIHQGKGITEKTRDLVLRPAYQMLTGGVIGQRAKELFDPAKREARTTLDEIRSRMPGFSTSVPPVRDNYGDIQVPPERFGGPWFGLAQPVVPAFKPYETDPVKIEGNRLQVKMPNFAWSIDGLVRPDIDIGEMIPGERTGVPLTADQRDKRIQIFRNMWRDPGPGGFNQAVMNNPEYKGTPERPTPVAAQRSFFELYMHNTWEASGRLLMGTDLDLGKRVLTNRAEQIKPKLDEAGKAQADIELIQSFGDLERLDTRDYQKFLQWDQGIIRRGTE